MLKITSPGLSLNKTFVTLFHEMVTKHIIRALKGELPEQQKSNDSWISIFGTPKIIQTDNGTSFAYEVITNLCELLGVKNKLITPYTPTANGRVERQHREIGRFVDTFQAKIVDGHSLELVLSITQIHLNQRSDAHVLTFGQEPTTVEQLLVTTLNNDPEEIDIDKLINIMAENTQWKLLQSD